MWMCLFWAPSRLGFPRSPHHCDTRSTYRMEVTTLWWMQVAALHGGGNTSQWSHLSDGCRSQHFTVVAALCWMEVTVFTTLDSIQHLPALHKQVALITACRITLRRCREGSLQKVLRRMCQEGVETAVSRKCREDCVENTQMNLTQKLTQRWNSCRWSYRFL